MHRYRMLADGDKILIAVSGGIDSLVLAAVLQNWQKKAPIQYQLTAVHLDMGFSPENTTHIRKQLDHLKLDYFMETISFPDIPEKEDKGSCFACARKRRNHLFELARNKNFSKLALGHHKEDIIETFFLNMLYSGNMSTMVPRQDLFDGNLSIIRPLALLEKNQILETGERLHLSAVTHSCPREHLSKRETVRTLLQQLYNSDHHIKANIFSALSNIRKEYLL
ncbi:MAG: tRNA 2-thiocytidine biosynthesis protein TtcA [Desulfobulbaceae bacterium]|nr:tRNA 2-thiocytidine biosynthesis protein TtcA [Desulfobulbaceae bacterium]